MLYQKNEEDTPSISFVFPPLVVGLDARRFDYEEGQYPIVLSSGRLFQPAESRVAVVGVDLARFQTVDLGKPLKIRGRDFEVVGLMERTLTARDNIAFVPLADAQEFLADSLPKPFNIDPYALASEIEVYPTDLGQADVLAETINRQIAGVRALPPGEIERQFSQSLVIFNVIVIGSAVIAVVVGGLAILNTMAMAVFERTHEIGIKKALGATNGDILGEFLREAVVMGFIGGMLGLSVGTTVVFLINSVTAGQGVIIFAVTPRLSVLVPVFSTVLGACAGLFPAYSAARRTPVEALRAE